MENEMIESQAIGAAKDWVRAHFPTVPPVAIALHLSRERLADSGINLASEDPREVELLSGKWVVTFRCSWDTDALGMPPTLIVAVDESGQVTRLDEPSPPSLAGDP
jgi:hypothetical protein